MNKSIFLTLIAFALVVAGSCSSQTSEDSEGEEVQTKDISELTFLEVYMLAFEDGSGGGMDFHGESFGVEAQSDLELIDGVPCMTKDCGTVQLLRNKNKEQELEVAIKASFLLPNNPAKEIYRYYLVPADSAVSVGCSHICHNGKRYPVKREINSAGYKAAEGK